uniref:SCP domain-containing protein n=1 Tax=Haemonchus contortus TaxID=6289 RepID=A0A7I4YTH2_HAECO
MFSLIKLALLALLTTSARASMCSDAEGMSDEVRKTFLDKHNEYRTLVAQGKAKNKSGGYAPMAARMLKMTYDCAIEKNMMDYAKECKFAHNSYKDRNYWGQNLWMSGEININKTHAAAGSVYAWFSELDIMAYLKRGSLQWRFSITALDTTLRSSGRRARRLAVR